MLWIGLDCLYFIKSVNNYGYGNGLFLIFLDFFYNFQHQFRL